MSIPRHAAVLTVLLLAGTALALACRSGSGNGNPTSTSTTPGQTTVQSPGLPTGDGKEPTATSLDQARERLAGQLNAIGANIGSVPDDIRQQILDRCHALEDFADPASVRPICQAIQQAIATNDPGIIDGVLRSLSQLQER